MSLRDRLVEAGADAMVGLPFDTLELRNWGEESVMDPARVLAEAAVDAFLDALSEHRTDILLAGGGMQFDTIIAALRETDTGGERA